MSRLLYYCTKTDYNAVHNFHGSNLHAESSFGVYFVHLSAFQSVCSCTVESRM